MAIAFTYRKGIWLFVLLFSLVNGYFLKDLRFNFEIDHLFPQGDEDLEFYQSKVKPFQAGNPFIIIAIESEKGIFNADFLQRIDALTAALDQDSLVEEGSSLTSIRFYAMNAFHRYRDRPFIRVDQPEAYERDSLFLYRYPDVKEKFISSHDQAVCVFVELKGQMPKEQTFVLLSRIREMLDSYGFSDFYINGDQEAQQAVQDLLKREVLMLSGLALIFIILVLWMSFRSWWGLWVPLLIIGLAVLWTMGTMAMLGISLNIMTVLVPTIILIIALSDVIHLLSRFKEHLQQGEAVLPAIRKTLSDIGMAIFLTSLTTALGFLTLNYANIIPISEFGTMTAIGVMYAYLLSILFLPNLLRLIPRSAIFMGDSKQYTASYWQSLWLWNRRNTKWILMGGLALFLSSLFFAQKLRINSYLYEEISAGDRYSESLNYFDQYFSGIRPVEIHLECLDSSLNLYQPEVLNKIDQLEEYLSDTYGLQSIYSIVTQVKRLNRLFHNGSPAWFRLPDLPRDQDYVFSMLDTSYSFLGLESILAPDYRSGMIVGQIQDQGSFISRKKNQELEAFMADLFPSSQYQAQLTGRSLLLDKSNEIICYKLSYGLLSALLLVALIVGLLFRSWKMILLALITNLIPLILIAGFMGFCATGLKISTALIFSIAFGIAVDDTIHFLSRLKVEWTRKGDLQEALKTTLISTGRAILLTSIILGLGFGILTSSAFTTTSITGLYISLTLILAVLADLVVLPALIQTVLRR